MSTAQRAERGAEHRLMGRGVDMAALNTGASTVDGPRPTEVGPDPLPA